MAGAYPCGPHCCGGPCYCNVDFSAVPVSDEEPACRTYYFQDLTSHNCQISEWHWYFGDAVNGQSFERNPSYTYGPSDDFVTVRLRVQLVDGTVCWGEKVLAVCNICSHCIDTPSQVHLTFSGIRWCSGYQTDINNGDAPDINGRTYVLTQQGCGSLAAGQCLFSYWDAGNSGGTGLSVVCEIFFNSFTGQVQYRPVASFVTGDLYELNTYYSRSLFGGIGSIGSIPAECLVSGLVIPNNGGTTCWSTPTTGSVETCGGNDPSLIAVLANTVNEDYSPDITSQVVLSSYE